MRRVGVLMGFPEGDALAQSYVAAMRDTFLKAVAVTAALSSGGSRCSHQSPLTLQHALRLGPAGFAPVTAWLFRPASDATTRIGVASRTLHHGERLLI